MNYIGIDLGGTNIKGALVSAKGEILKEHSIPTRVDLGPEAVAGRIGQVIAQLSIGEDTVGGVGVGCPGTVDDASGIVRFAANLNFVNFDLRSALRAHTALPIHLGNDANAAALGEVIKLSERQVAMMRNAGPGEGLLVAGGKIIPFENRIPTDSAIYRMVTTKLDDLIQYSNEDGRAGARRG